MTGDSSGEGQAGRPPLKVGHPACPSRQRPNFNGTVQSPVGYVTTVVPACHPPGLDPMNASGFFPVCFSYSCIISMIAP